MSAFRNSLFVQGRQIAKTVRAMFYHTFEILPNWKLPRWTRNFPYCHSFVLRKKNGLRRCGVYKSFSCVFFCLAAVNFCRFEFHSTSFFVFPMMSIIRSSLFTPRFILTLTCFKSSGRCHQCESKTDKGFITFNVYIFDQRYTNLHAAHNAALSKSLKLQCIQKNII